MLITDKIYKVIIAILGAFILFLLVNTYIAERKYSALESSFNQYKKEIADQKVRDDEARAALKKANDEAIDKLKSEALTAKAKHEDELREIKTQYDTVKRANDQLLSQVRDFNAKWDTYDEATRKNYARAASDGVAQCLIRAEQYKDLALGYNSEVVYLRSIFPQMNIDGTMTMYDPQTKTTTIFSGPIEIKTNPESIRTLPPEGQDSF